MSTVLALSAILLEIYEGEAQRAPFWKRRMDNEIKAAVLWFSQHFSQTRKPETL